ncbi:histidine kinase dimerization/phospho-acceptor domain-containing protein, partial [Pseudopedobacter sp.]|uniref:PAS domain-containing sensor histidine kinase n=1 Tax=Pseudopedobacter sp. TaxID=1936787 RepID=UPI00333E20E8
MYLHPVFKNGLQKKTRKSSRELAAHLQTLLTSLEDIVFEIDGNQTFKNVWVSDEAVLFIPKDQIIGKKVADVMGPQSLMFTEPIDTVIKTGEVHEITYKHLDKAINKWYKLRIKPVVKASDLSNYVLVLSIQDITQQRLAELVLQETKERFESNNELLDVSQKLSQTAGWEFSLLTAKVFWTQQAYLLFDVNDNFEPTSINCLSFFPEQERQLLKEHNERAIYHKIPYDLELKIITATGINKWVRAIGVPVIKNDEVIMLRGALMDITLKKENELALIKAKDLAESASKAKSDFLSIMSHEIRTPLNGIIGIANLLKLNHTHDQKEYIHDLIFSADHLLQLINDVLDFAKVENNKLELQLREVNLFQLVKDIKKQFIPSILRKDIQLKNFIDDNIPEKIIADPIRLGQILNNLI